MADIGYEPVVFAGTEPTFVAATAGAGGDLFAAHAHGVAIVRNDDAAPITVTVRVPGNTKYGVAEPDYTVAVPAGEERFIKLDPALVDTADNGIKLTYSAVANVTVAAVSV